MVSGQAGAIAITISKLRHFLTREGTRYEFSRTFLQIKDHDSTGFATDEQLRPMLVRFL